MTQNSFARFQWNKPLDTYAAGTSKLTEEPIQGSYMYQ